MPPVQLGRMLSLYGSVYKSLEIRTACFNDGSSWRNILTVIRFSNDEKKIVEERVMQHFARLGNIRSEKFRIIFSTRDFDEWNSLIREFEQGGVLLGDLRIVYDGSPSLESLSADIRRYTNYAVHENGYNVLEVYSTRGRIPNQVLQSFDSDAVRAAFLDIYQAINALLGAKYGSGITTDIIAVCPALATFEIEEFDPNTRRRPAGP